MATEQIMWFYHRFNLDTMGVIAHCFATGLAALMNSNTTLQSLGVTAQASANVVNVKFNPTNYPSASAVSVGGATETLSLAMSKNVNQQALISGTKTTGDVLTLGVNDVGLSGGASTVSYTVLSSDTLATITTGLAAAVNASSTLQAIGVSASASSTTLTLKSNSPNVTRYNQGTNSGATETILVGLNPNGTEPIAIGGTKTTGNVLTVVVTDAGLTSGPESVAYTVQSADTLSTIATGIAAAINADTNLQAIGVTATAVSTVVNVKSVSTNATTYSQLRSSGATETLTLAPGANLTGDSFNTMNELVARSAAGPVAFAGETNKPVKSASIQSSTIAISGPQDFKVNTYSGATAGSGPFISPANTFATSATTKGSQLYYYGIASGVTITPGLQWSVVVANPDLPNGQVTATYTSITGDTITSVGTGIANAVSSNSALQAAGLSAVSGYDPVTTQYYVTVNQAVPTYTAATNSGATETVSTGQSATPNTTMIVSGTITAGDTVSLTAHYPALPSGQTTVTYTVLSGDTVKSIAAGVAALFNANSNAQALDLTATNLLAGTLYTSETFSANPILGASQNNVSVSAVDGGNNTKTNPYLVNLNGTPTQSLSYDLNGNLLNDGTNTYQWDVENRLIQINSRGLEITRHLLMMD